MRNPTLRNTRSFAIVLMTLIISLASCLPVVPQIEEAPVDPKDISIPTQNPGSTPYPTSTPVIPTQTLGAGSILVSEKDGMTMLYIPGGTFAMGMNAADALEECSKHQSNCRKDWFLFEEPVHEVALSPYWIDSTEVTNSMYKRCVDDDACNPPDQAYSPTRKSYYGNSAYADFPVIYVSWGDARSYCEWAGKELLTEAQWEFAARGIDGRIYPWGNSAPSCDLANYIHDADKPCVGDTTAVGSYESGKSPFGVYDMAGNVSEWVADWYASYPAISQVDPQGPNDPQSDKVLRGGSINNLANGLRSTFRHALNPSYSYYYFSVGFRCGLNP